MRDRNAATQQYYPNECTVEDFFDIIDDEKAREMFVKNMENLKLINCNFLKFGLIFLLDGWS